MNKLTCKNKFDCVIAIDPGVNGGLAILKGSNVVSVMKMPRELMNLRPFFNSILNDFENPIVFIEKVQLQHRDFGSGVPGKVFNIQKMLKGYERLKAIIEFCGIKLVEVHPMTWQSCLKIRVKGEEKKDKKNRYKLIAHKLHPNLKATLWNADALLILEFAIEKINNDSWWISERINK